jgi:cytochrome o ubiquinol oxidase subunit 2
MKRGVSITLSIAVAIVLVTLFGWLSTSGQIDVLNPAGQIADSQKQLLIFTLALSAIVVLPVFMLLIVFAFRYRNSNKKHPGYDPEWSENKWLEGLWWGIPIFIIGILAVVTFQTSHSLDPRQTLSGDDPMRVQVVALQWKWLFIYPDQGIATLNHLPLQVNRPVTFSLTANAPMSAFWIPALGSQTYAMNGMASTLNLKATKTGEYMGYTTNINGKGYADMKFTAKVMDKQNYEKK